MNHKKGY